MRSMLRRRMISLMGTAKSLSAAAGIAPIHIAHTLMTDRKAAHRRRTKAGFVYLGKFIRKGDLPSVQDKLLTAEQVDAEIAEKGDGDEQSK